MSGTAGLVRLRSVLPQGGRLPEATWRNRHRWVVRLLWVHVALIPAYGLVRGYALDHLLLETMVVVLAAVAASTDLIDRRRRTVIASLGLLACSGILVHLSGGMIEMHFHFFVMVAVVSLYQDWAPFLTAIAFVFLQHGVFGVLDPTSVFNHPAAIANPWRWAAVHAAFIAAESVACLVNWRLNESLYDSEHAARVASESARSDLSLLVDATEALTSSFDVEVDVMLQGLVSLVAPTVADGCAVDLLEEDAAQLTRVASAGSVPATLHRAALRCVRGGAVFRSSAADGEGSAVVVPVSGRGGLLGALSLSCDRGGRILDESALQVAVELGRRAGIAVENARLYARERSVALTLQQALLPERLPQIPGLQSAARYVAGGPGVDVGGDWYDVIPLPRGRLLVVMGDVVGRGEKAAALMGQLRSYLRGHSLVADEPAALLTHLNRLLHDANQSDMATLLCALLDPATCRLRIASAGHPPPVMRGADGSVRWLSEATGPPLGAVAGATYASAPEEMAPGSTLLLYTDGIVEDRATSIDVGLDELATALAEAPLEADALCEHVLRHMLGDRRACDDAALLAVTLLPLDEQLTLDLPRDLSGLEPMRAMLGRWLKEMGATEEETYEVLVATCEAAANAIVHARGPAASSVRVQVRLDEDLSVVVQDFGTWRAPQTGTGGRGMSIMESFMDEVRVDATDGGTVVEMRRRLSSHPTVVDA